MKTLVISATATAIFFLTIMATMIHAFDLSNLTVPQTMQIGGDCNPNSTNPALTWCKYSNTFILSDFLARNSSKLTANSDFEIAVDWIKSPRGRMYDEALALRQIRTGTTGTLIYKANDTANHGLPSLTYTNILRIVVYTDRKGSLLLIDFNKNEMLKSTSKVGFSSVEFFGLVDVVRESFRNSTVTEFTADMILLMGNASDLALMTYDSEARAITAPCNVYHLSPEYINGAQFKLVTVQFYPDLPSELRLDPDFLVYLITASSINIAGAIRISTPGAPVPSFLEDWTQFQLQMFPARQQEIRDYIRLCPRHPPKYKDGEQRSQQLTIRINEIEQDAVKFVFSYNANENVVYTFAYSKKAIMMIRSVTTGISPQTQAEGGFNRTLYVATNYFRRWCEPHLFYVANGTMATYPRSKSTVYCAPGTGSNDPASAAAEITSLSVLSGTTLMANKTVGPNNQTNPRTNNQYLVIGLKNSTSVYSRIIDLPELTFGDDGFSDPSRPAFNPLGLRSDFGTATFPCDFDREAFNPKTGQCVPRFIVEFDVADPSAATEADITDNIISKITSVGVKQDASLSKQQSSSANNGVVANFNVTEHGKKIKPSMIPAPPMISEDHAMLFFARGRRVFAFILFFKDSNITRNPIVNFANSITFLGKISTMHVSPNAQHLFTSISRPRWQLDAQNRYADLCDAATAKTSDGKDKNLFVAVGFGAVCAKEPPQRVNLNSYCQYASNCGFQMNCPSLTSASASPPPSGTFAERPAVLRLCERGYFCVLGSQQQCTPGGYCDEEGMSEPKACGNLPENETCAAWGNTAIQPCAPGSVCVAAHIPGLPSPPGYFVPTAGAIGRDQFVPCPSGFWCPIGAYVSQNITNSNNNNNNQQKQPAAIFKSPALSFTPSPTALSPIICVCTNDEIYAGNGSVVKCNSRVLYCPAGTVDLDKAWCPAGSWCGRPDQKTECMYSQWCPPGTAVPQTCPQSYYCPDPSQRVLCPKGHYCQSGSTEPRPCSPLAICKEGSYSEQTSFVAPIIIVAIIGAIVGGFYLFRRFDQSKQAKSAEIEALDADLRAELLSSSAMTEEEVESKAAKMKGGDDASAVDMSPLGGSGGQKFKANLPTSPYPTPHISCRDMSLDLAVGPQKGSRILDRVNLEIPPGSLLSVMGPSGSAKTTLITCLFGRAFYGVRTGEVKINGDADVSMDDLNKIIGFVKQNDDANLAEMTVAEGTIFNARMRYDAANALDSPEGIANAMLKALEINHVRDTIAGSATKKGISGGQKRRLSMATEMAALPSILCLDEPTSGLDSTSSLTVLNALREISNTGVTVMAVIHQPRYEIFQLFDKVMLLAKGGKAVFYGSPSQALRYFEDVLEIKCPANCNPADFFMDNIQGTPDSKYTVDELQQKWVDYCAAEKKKDSSASSSSDAAAAAAASSTMSPAAADDNNDSKQQQTATATNSKNGKEEEMKFEVTGKQLAAMAAKKQMAPFFTQLWLFTHRSMVQLSRDIAWQLVDLALVAVAGFFLALVFSRSKYIPALPSQIINRSLAGFGSDPPPTLVAFFDRPVIDPVISEASLSCMGVAMCVVMASLRVFGGEQLTYWREASVGMSGTAYFLGKNITHLIFIFLNPILYLVLFTTFTNMRANMIELYPALLAVSFTTAGLGYLVSIVAPASLAQLGGIVLVLVLSMFAGARPTLPQINEMFAPLRALPYLSYQRWAQEAFYLTEIKKWGEVRGINIEPSLKLFDYHLDNYGLGLGITFAYGVVFRVIACVCMILMNSDQKR